HLLSGGRVCRLRRANKKSDLKGRFFLQPPKRSHANLAQWTGLEPATPGVTGRASQKMLIVLILQLLILKDFIPTHQLFRLMQIEIT
ncbi:MAG: hypothetical protein V7751_19880, partial [Pseudoalteromonas distincta]